MRPHACWAVLLSVLVVASSTRSAEPENKNDLYGDPLPRGAISRLGTLRFRHEANAPVALAFSPDARLLVSVAGGTDKTVRAWETASGKPLWTLKREVHCIAFSPDGKTLACGGNAGNSGFVDALSGELLEDIDCERKVLSLSFSPDGAKLALATSAWPSLQICVRNSKGGGAIAKPIEAIRGTLEQVAFSPTGEWLLCAGGSGYWVLDANTNKLIKQWSMESGRVTGLGFSPDSKRLYAGIGNPFYWSIDNPWGQIVCFKLPEGDYESMVTTGHFPYRSFSIDRRGERLACANGSSGLVYNLETKTELFRTPPANAGLAAISSDGKLLATFGSRVQIFDIATGKNMHSFPDGFSSDDFRTFSTSGKLFATRRHLWDVQTGKLVHELKGAGRIVFSPDGSPMSLTLDKRRLTARSLGDLPFGWEVETDSSSVSPATGHAIYLSKMGDDDKRSTTNLRNLSSGLDEHRLANEGIGEAGKQPEAWQMGLSRDGRQLAVVTHTSHLQLHTLGQENFRATAEPLPGLPQNNRSTPLISPDGKHVALVPDRRSGQIEVLGTGQLESTAALRDLSPLGYDNAKAGAAFLAGKPQLAVMRGGEQAPALLKVWDISAEGLTKKTWLKDRHDFRRAVLWLAGNGLRGDLPTGFVPLDSGDQSLPALQCRLSSSLLNTIAAVSRSGELVAVADDFSISIWETATGQVVQRMQSGAETIAALTFSPDDKLLLVHCANETALVFPAIQPASELQTRPTRALAEELSGTNAKAARKALLELSRRGAEVLFEFDGKLPRKLAPEKIHALIAALDGPDKTGREAAQEKLRLLGAVATPHLRATLRLRPSDEQIVRIRAILANPTETVADPDMLGGIRAVQLAALIGTEPALAWLRQIARGNYDERLSSRAAETLARMRTK